MKQLFLGVLVLLLPISSLAKTGNECRQLSENSQGFHVDGLVDSFAFGGDLSKAYSKDPKLDNAQGILFDCLSKEMIYHQLAAIVTKYMDDRPEEVMPYITLMAIMKSCNR